MTGPLKSATEAITIVGELIKVAGENPETREAGRNIGAAALTVSKTINNALLPLAAVNYAFDKARIYFAEKFPQELSQKAAAIPDENLVEPKASIAGPALQGLAFTHEEPKLKDMYLSLLVTAMDGRSAFDAHPAFVEIIKQLTSEEAAFLKELLSIGAAIAIIEIRKSENNVAGYNILEKHIVNLRDMKSGAEIENSAFPAMIDNWIRLGLVEVDYTIHLISETSYAWVNSRPEYIRHLGALKSEQENISFQKGMLIRTALGSQFARAVGLVSATGLGIHLPNSPPD